MCVFRLRRNSCADSSQGGQYARMGPLQYFFLCGLLCTQTHGKFCEFCIFCLMFLFWRCFAGDVNLKRVRPQHSLVSFQARQEKKKRKKENPSVCLSVRIQSGFVKFVFRKSEMRRTLCAISQLHLALIQKTVCQANYLVAWPDESCSFIHKVWPNWTHL